MKTAAIAYISFFENTLIQKIYDVDSAYGWKDVLEIAVKDGLIPGVKWEDDYKEWILNMPDDLNKAREEMVNGEMDVVATFLG